MRKRPKAIQSIRIAMMSIFELTLEFNVKEKRKQ